MQYQAPRSKSSLIALEKDIMCTNLFQFLAENSSRDEHMRAWARLCLIILIPTAGDTYSLDSCHSIAYARQPDMTENADPFPCI